MGADSHYRSGHPADCIAIPPSHRLDKTLNENIYGIPQRLDSAGVLRNVLRHAQLSLRSLRILGTVALIWLWDLFTGYTPFERNPKYHMLAGVLYAMPFLYPLLSWARGMEFPMMTTTVMPCSVAAFTIGLLLAFSRKVNLLVILFLCHWALIAFSKVYVYKIPEDLLLASATVPAIYLFFKNYIAQNLHKETKLSARLMNWFLILMCIVIGVFLSITLFQEVGK